MSTLRFDVPTTVRFAEFQSERYSSIVNITSFFLFSSQSTPPCPPWKSAVVFSPSLATILRQYVFDYHFKLYWTYTSTTILLLSPSLSQSSLSPPVIKTTVLLFVDYSFLYGSHSSYLLIFIDSRLIEFCLFSVNAPVKDKNEDFGEYLNKNWLVRTCK